MLFRKKSGSGNQKESIFNQKNSNVFISIKDQEQQLQLKIIELTEEDLQIAHALKPYIEIRVKEIVEAFYEKIGSIPEFRDMINQYSSSERLSHALRHHIIEMFEGRIDDQYLEKRSRISKMHAKIGLSTKWYLASFEKVALEIKHVIYDLELSSEDTRKAILAISKIINFEQQIVLEEYDKISNAISTEKQEKVRQEVKETVGGISKRS